MENNEYRSKFLATADDFAYCILNNEEIFKTLTKIDNEDFHTLLMQFCEDWHNNLQNNINVLERLGKR